MRLPPLPTISDIIRLYQLRARKHLAQNFLLDMNLCHKIAKQMGDVNEKYVCEVGPGPGGITRAILEAGAKQVITIEKDPRFSPGLQLISDATEGRLINVEGDILEYDMSNMFPKELARPWDDKPPDIHIIGNLPFNVSTPLIIRWLSAISNRNGAWSYGRTKLTLTFQKEIGERMIAEVKSSERCRLSIMCQHLCHVQLRFVIPGRAFVPAPDVDVAVVTFTPFVKPKIDLPFRLVEKVCRHIFHYRNKYCIRGIETLFPPTLPHLANELCEKASIDPQQRCWHLTMKDMNRVCTTYDDICQQHPNIRDYDYRSQANSKDWSNRRNIQKELLEQSILEM